MAAILEERATQEKQVSPQSPLAHLASERQELAEWAPPAERARLQQEREEPPQSGEQAAAPPRQVSCELLWRPLLSLPFPRRLFARQLLPLRLRRGSACAPFRRHRRLSNSSASFSL